MTQTMRAITLARRPSGLPVPEDFALVERPLPAPGPGEVLIAASHLSLDPYMRGRMDDVKSYAEPVAIGGVMTGEGVGRVIASRADSVAEGDLVIGQTGWASYAVLRGDAVRVLDDGLPPSTALGVLGMPGFTAWTGLRKYGLPKAGETLVVGAATGPVGSLVGQLAKTKGLRVIAVAGGAEKCALAVEQFGFDAAVDHRSHDNAEAMRGALAEAAPEGVDIYWDNVAGRTLEAVLPLMNQGGRVPVCGTIAWTGGRAAESAASLPAAWRAILVKRLSVQGFIIFDHYEDFPDFLADMTPRIASGAISFLEDVTQGLENMPAAFIGLLQGRNRGKAIVAV
jgi:NADPH-dependent curcumin reductase CurA